MGGNLIIYNSDRDSLSASACRQQQEGILFIYFKYSLGDLGAVFHEH